MFHPQFNGGAINAAYRYFLQFRISDWQPRTIWQCSTFLIVIFWWGESSSTGPQKVKVKDTIEHTIARVRQLPTAKNFWPKNVNRAEKICFKVADWGLQRYSACQHLLCHYRDPNSDPQNPCKVRSGSLYGESQHSCDEMGVGDWRIPGCLWTSRPGR